MVPKWPVVRSLSFLLPDTCQQRAKRTYGLLLEACGVFYGTSLLSTALMRCCNSGPATRSNASLVAPVVISVGMNMPERTCVM